MNMGLPCALAAASAFGKSVMGLAAEAALVDAGAPDNSVKAVVKGALKTLGSKVIGEAADQVAEGIVDRSADFLGPLVNAGIEQIRDRWSALYPADGNEN